jgi:hypothetical protein
MVSHALDAALASAPVLPVGAGPAVPFAPPEGDAPPEDGAADYAQSALPF